jgi:hypothetical protein
MAKQISMVQILRDADGEVEDVTVGDSLAEILDVDANITARCDLPQMFQDLGRLDCLVC